MDRHLVAIEVCIEGRTHERRYLDGLVVNEHRLEGLNGQAVERWRTVEQDDVPLDDPFQRVPHFRGRLFHEVLGHLHAADDAFAHEPVDHMGLEELERHLLGNATLADLELRAGHDHGAARVVDTLAQQVLPEPPFLPFQLVAQGAQRTSVGIHDGILALAVVQQGVDGILEHALLVLKENLGSILVDHLAQAVVAVNDAAVQLVQVIRSKPSSLELHQRAQVRRDNRDTGQNHVCRLPAVVDERRHHVKLLDRLCAVLTRLALDTGKQCVSHLVQVKILQQVQECVRALLGHELLPVDLPFPILFVGKELLDGKSFHIARVQHQPAAEVDDLLDGLAGHFQKERDVVDGVAEVPDVRDGGMEFDVSHALAADTGIGNLDVTLVADLALEAFSLELAAPALVTLGRSKDDLTEESVGLWLAAPVIKRFGLGHLTV